MCRIRFSLAGIHFDDIELYRPVSVVDEDYRPLISTVPLIVGGQGRHKQPNSTSVEGSHVQQRHSRPKFVPPPATSSSLIGDECEKQALQKKPQESTSHAKEAQKTQKAELETPGKTPDQKGKKDIASTTSGPTPALSTKPRLAKATASDEKSSAVKPRSILKQVRFSDMVEEKENPKDDGSDTSSDTSCDSYTDPPPPPKSNHYTANASTVPANRGDSSGLRLARTPMLDEYPSSDESGIDIGPSLKAPGKVRQLSSGSSATRSPASQSMDSSDLGSNVDLNGREHEGTRFHRQQMLSPIGPDAQAPKLLRSRKQLPDPIFVVRSNKHTTVSQEPRRQMRIRGE